MVECWFCRRTTEDLVKWVNDHADDFTDPENPLQLSKDLADVIFEWVHNKDEPFSDYKGIKVCFGCIFTLREFISQDVLETNPEFTNFLENEIKGVIRDAFRE